MSLSSVIADAKMMMLYIVLLLLELDELEWQPADLGDVLGDILLIKSIDDWTNC